MSDLWNLVWGKPEVDPKLLALAVEQEIAVREPDHRTKVLIRDSSAALKQYWGDERWHRWLEACPVGNRIQAILSEALGEKGFPHLGDQLMECTEPEVVEQFLREVGLGIRAPAILYVGGSIGLILTGFLSRSTSDIDVADEVPLEVRSELGMLENLAHRYGLIVTHFQSGYLPDGWKDRCEFHKTYGKLTVYLVDVYDVFLGKVFSAREKDLDDARVLLPKLDRERIASQMRRCCARFLDEPLLEKNATRNWYILTGDELPS